MKAIDKKYQYLGSPKAREYKEEIENAGFEPKDVILRPYGVECKIGIVLNFGRIRWLSTVADVEAFLDEAAEVK